MPIHLQNIPRDKRRFEYFGRLTQPGPPERPLPLIYHPGSTILTPDSRYIFEESSSENALIKRNVLVRNGSSDPFVHYMAHIFNPDLIDDSLPALLLVPGIDSNGNNYRISPDKGQNYLDLSQPNSFANKLAFLGYHVFIVNPRFARWIYTRFVENKLGVKNTFPDSTTFSKLVSDLGFYIDVSLKLSGAPSAAVLAFSMGGMELLYYLAFSEQIDPRLSHAVFLGTPAKFSKEKKLYHLLYTYRLLSKILPAKNHSLLGYIASHMVPIKTVVRALPDRVVESAPVDQILNPSQLDKGAITALARYVLEPLAGQVFWYMMQTVDNGGIRREQDSDALLDDVTEPTALEMLGGINIPALIMSGTKDGLLIPGNDGLIYHALGSRHKERVEVDDSGHVDLLCGYNFPTVVGKIDGFIRSAA